MITVTEITKLRQSTKDDANLIHPCVVTEEKTIIEIQRTEQTPVFEFHYGDIIQIEVDGISLDVEIYSADVKDQQIYTKHENNKVCICDVCWNEDERPFFKAVEFINH